MNGTLTITKATARVYVTVNAFTYDGQPHPTTAMARGVFGELLELVSLTYNGSSTPPIHAGHYTAVGTYAGTDNYEPGTSQTTLTITKSALTVKADDGSKVYGSPNPAFTASISGFAAGE